MQLHINYQPDREKIEQLTRIRYQEQAQMREYMKSRQLPDGFSS